MAASATSTLAAPRPLTGAPAPAIGWLRNPQFDFTLIVLAAVWALAAGAAIVVEPSWFWPILFLDVWMLGYTHVVSTFTRLAFDRESFRQHRMLLIPLPILVAAFTIAVALVVGEWLVATVYLYAQWFHYTRQSYGISRMYLRKANAVPASRDLVLDGVIYALPLWGILSRSHEQPSSFLGLPIYTFPVPAAMVYAVGAIAVVSIALWLLRELRLLGRRRADAPHSAYVASHIAIFTVGYLVIPDINAGWLVLNIWHNLQYVLIVWMFNAGRFSKGIDPERRFLSTISQPRNALIYALVCWAIGTILYFNINRALAVFSSSVLPLSLLAYMTINFHHYVVDAVIWRRPRRPTAA
jgi:hypothetical protein